MRPRRGLMLFTALVLALVALSGCVSTNDTSAQPTMTTNPPATIAPGANDLQQNVINVIRAVQPTVAEIEGFSDAGGAIGSGEILTSDGYRKRAGKLPGCIRERNRRSFVQRGMGKAFHPAPHERLTTSWESSRI